MKATTENLRLNPKLDVRTGERFFCKALKPKRTQFLQGTNASQKTEIAQAIDKLKAQEIISLKFKLQLVKHLNHIMQTDFHLLILHT